MILVPDSESLREFNACHDQGDGRFCSSPSVGSPAFTEWFGRSQVVDEEGNPLRAYRGAASEQDVVDTARPSRSGKGHWMGDLGAWFTAPSKFKGNYDEGNAPDQAAGYTEKYDRVTGSTSYKKGAHVKPVFLRIEHPMEYEGYDDFDDQRWDGKTRLTGAALKAKLIAQGYDGVVIRNSDTDGNVDRDDWVAFYPHQIKSAIGNRGTYSRDSRRITEYNTCHRQ